MPARVEAWQSGICPSLLLWQASQDHRSVDPPPFFVSAARLTGTGRWPAAGPFFRKDGIYARIARIAPMSDAQEKPPVARNCWLAPCRATVQTRVFGGKRVYPMQDYPLKKIQAQFGRGGRRDPWEDPKQGGVPPMDGSGGRHGRLWTAGRPPESG